MGNKEAEAGATTIWQTVYKRSYLDRSTIQGNSVEEARTSAELYNMILSCVGIGYALNTR